MFAFITSNLLWSEGATILVILLGLVWCAYKLKLRILQLGVLGLILFSLFFFRNPNRFMAFVIILACLFIGYFMLKAIMPRLKDTRHVITFNLLLFFMIVSLNPLLLRGDLGGYLSISHNL